MPVAWIMAGETVFTVMPSAARIVAKFLPIELYPVVNNFYNFFFVNGNSPHGSLGGSVMAAVETSAMARDASN